MSHNKEATIIAGMRSGNKEVLDTFYHQNYGCIRRYILQNTGSDQDVEDIFQDGLVIMYQKLALGSLKINSPLQGYFYGICRNLWRNQLRCKKKLILSDRISSYSDQMNLVDPPEISCKEEEAIYKKHFCTLSKSDQQVWDLFFDGKSVREVAKITGYSESYTRKKKFHSKNKLQKMIEKDLVYRELQMGDRVGLEVNCLKKNRFKKEISKLFVSVTSY